MPVRTHSISMHLRRCLRSHGASAALLAAMLAYIALPVVHTWSHGAHPVSVVLEAGAAGHDDHEGHACTHSGEADPHRHGPQEPGPTDPHDEHDCAVCLVLALGRAATVPSTIDFAPPAPTAEQAGPETARTAAAAFHLIDAPPRGPPAA